MLSSKDQPQAIFRGPELEALIERLPGVQAARVYSDERGEPRISVHVEETPAKRVIREVVSTLRSSGWTAVEPEMVSVVNMPRRSARGSRVEPLQIAGYSVVRAPDGVTAECRLSAGERLFEGQATGTTILSAMVTACLIAANQWNPSGVPFLLEIADVVAIGGHEAVLVTLRDVHQEVILGSALLGGLLEEPAIMATLDAVSRGIADAAGM